MELKEMYKQVALSSLTERTASKIPALIADRNRLLDDAIGTLQHMRDDDGAKIRTCAPQNVINRLNTLLEIETQIWCMRWMAEELTEIVNIDTATE